MPDYYVKVFQKILDSTVWLEPMPTRIVWFTLMAMSDRNGIVDAPIPAIANRARVTLEECREAMEKFQQPDPDSRTPDLEGRRIVKVDGGWKLVIHAKYRALMGTAERREYQAKWQKGYRDQIASGSRKPGKRRGRSQAEVEQNARDGEARYLKAEREGASLEELDRIVTETLPRGSR